MEDRGRTTRVAIRWSIAAVLGGIALGLLIANLFGGDPPTSEGVLTPTQQIAHWLNEIEATLEAFFWLAVVYFFSRD